jgi:glucose-1-phosphate thymidylyltransferase
MRIIIPMAGRGSRLRPQTLTVPKPLIPIAGKPIVQRIVEDFNASFPNAIEEIAFVIGDFGAAVEKQLQEIAALVGARCSLYRQEQPLGPAHAIWCARESLDGECLVVFADTLFKADFRFDLQEDGIIWVQKVDNPSSFGVVTTDSNNYIQAFVEKPQEFVSDKAIVGIYYFRDGQNFRQEVDYLISNNILDKGEFQITSVLENMKNRSIRFRSAEIDEWLDCGNKDNVLLTNRRMLELKSGIENLIDPSVHTENAIIIPPCYIGPGTFISNSVIGPFVSIGANCRVEHAVIQDSLVQNDSTLRKVMFSNSMIGNQAQCEGRLQEWSIGDFTVAQQ